jgi:hypothetical protein
MILSHYVLDIWWDYKPYCPSLSYKMGGHTYFLCGPCQNQYSQRVKLWESYILESISIVVVCCLCSVCFSILLSKIDLMMFQDMMSHFLCWHLVKIIKLSVPCQGHLVGPMCTLYIASVTWSCLKQNYWQLAISCEPKELCIQCNVTQELFTGFYVKLGWNILYIQRLPQHSSDSAVVGIRYDSMSAPTLRQDGQSDRTVSMWQACKLQ